MEHDKDRPSIQIRPLTEDDAAQYRALRIQAVTDHPIAFWTSPEEETCDDVEGFAKRIREQWSDPGWAQILGAFKGEQLLAQAGFKRQKLLKLQHRPELGGVYVTKQAQGLGLGKILINAVIDHLRTLQGVEMLSLAVAHTNTGARKLYESLGFQYMGPLPFAMKLSNGTYAHEERMALWLNPEQQTQAQHHRNQSPASTP